MGILRRIKNRLTVVGRDPTPTPQEKWSPPTPPPTAKAPTPGPKPRSAGEVRTAIEADIAEHSVVLFMKGTPTAPGCGFSAAVAALLNDMGSDYLSRDVLSDPTLRQEIKEFSDWPTLPQLYIGGEFVGGCDIVREMNDKGELRPMIDEALGT